MWGIFRDTWSNSRAEGTIPQLRMRPVIASDWKLSTIRTSKLFFVCCQRVCCGWNHFKYNSWRHSACRVLPERKLRAADYCDCSHVDRERVKLVVVPEVSARSVDQSTGFSSRIVTKASFHQCSTYIRAFVTSPFSTTSWRTSAKSSNPSFSRSYCGLRVRQLHKGATSRFCSTARRIREQEGCAVTGEHREGAMTIAIFSCSEVWRPRFCPR